MSTVRFVMKHNSCWNRLRGPLVVLTLVLIASCHSDPSSFFDMKERQIAEGEVTTMLHDYQNAVREQGLMGEFEFLDSSMDFFWIPPAASEAMNFAAVKAAVTENAKSLDTISCEWQHLKVHALTADIATYEGQLIAFSIAKNGDTSNVELVESGTVIKRADGWKLLSGQTSMVQK